jgi:hypothetical protein
MMKNDLVYSTAEICEIFNISKSTLFRWEKEGQIPPVPRDLSGQRQYTQEHISAISERQKQQLGKRYAQAIKTGSETNLLRISEAISMRKFLEGDVTGLYELAELQEVSSDTLRQLMQLGLDRFEPGNKVFCEIIRVLWEHTRGSCDA